MRLALVRGSLPKVRMLGSAWLVTAAMMGCQGGGEDESAGVSATEAGVEVAALQRLSCDDSMKSAFKPDANTTVVLVKAFKAGDPLALAATPPAPPPPTAVNDVCVVKLLVGPGNPGPAGAPSTSAGIGIEVWLPTPANWNNRIHNVGGGGWAGTAESSAVVLAGTGAGIAMIEGAVSASTDAGHFGSPPVIDASFTMNPDGTINTTLWKDFSQRSLHELAAKTKALTRAYYGRSAKYAYFAGGSTGGRQGLKTAQVNPADYDGLLIGFPAINWTKFITAELYPQIVMQRDLGGVNLGIGQLDLASNAAIAACDVVGGQHLGYILDPRECRYDPTNDPAVLCQANGGTNATADCLTPVQATAINKFWFGQTTDGSVPSPAVDVGAGITPAPNQRWFGPLRGTTLLGLAGPFAFPIATDQVAVELDDGTLGGPFFRNASGNGADGWKKLSFSDLSRASDRGVELQPEFGNINTDDANLLGLRFRGGKIVMWHGLADELIMPTGSINYYERVAARMGGIREVQKFFRFYLVPGEGHGLFNGTANPAANPPLPTEEQLYRLITDWVEKGVAPDRVDISTTATPAFPQVKSAPICLYPQKATFKGGDPNVAASYACS
jgi:hypothetical protein